MATVVTTSWMLLLLLHDETDAGWAAYLGCASVEIGVASDYLVVVRRSDQLRPEPGDHIEIRAVVVCDVDVFGVRLQIADCRIRIEIPW